MEDQAMRTFSPKVRLPIPSLHAELVDRGRLVPDRRSTAPEYEAIFLPDFYPFLSPTSHFY